MFAFLSLNITVTKTVNWRWKNRSSCASAVHSITGFLSPTYDTYRLNRKKLWNDAIIAKILCISQNISQQPTSHWLLNKVLCTCFILVLFMYYCSVYSFFIYRYFQVSRFSNFMWFYYFIIFLYFYLVFILVIDRFNTSNLF